MRFLNEMQIIEPPIIQTKIYNTTNPDIIHGNITVYLTSFQFNKVGTRAHAWPSARVNTTFSSMSDLCKITFESQPDPRDELRTNNLVPISQYFTSSHLESSTKIVPNLTYFLIIYILFKGKSLLFYPRDHPQNFSEEEAGNSFGTPFYRSIESI